MKKAEVSVDMSFKLKIFIFKTDRDFPGVQTFWLNLILI